MVISQSGDHCHALAEGRTLEGGGQAAAGGPHSWARRLVEAFHRSRPGSRTDLDGHEFTSLEAWSEGLSPLWSMAAWSHQPRFCAFLFRSLSLLGRGFPVHSTFGGCTWCPFISRASATEGRGTPWQQSRQSTDAPVLRGIGETFHFSEVRLELGREGSRFFTDRPPILMYIVGVPEGSSHETCLPPS